MTLSRNAKPKRTRNKDRQIPGGGTNSGTTLQIPKGLRDALEGHGHGRDKRRERRPLKGTESGTPSIRDGLLNGHLQGTTNSAWRDI